jgi:hypothetical protein
MSQGFGRKQKRRATLEARKDPLLALNHLIEWELFRSVWREIEPTPVAGKAGRKPIDRMLLFKMLLVLSSKIVTNKTQEPFITSDHLVVLYNQFLESRKKYGSNTGLACKGLEIFFPVSPKQLLILFDHDVYKVGNKNDTVINVTDLGDIRTLNLIQCISANENLYFNSEASQAQIRNLVKSATRHRREAKANINEYAELKTDEEMRFLLHMYRSDVQCSSSLSFIRLLKKARYYTLEDKILHVRDIRICRLHEQFVEQVKKGRYCASEFSKFLRDVSKSS